MLVEGPAPVEEVESDAETLVDIETPAAGRSTETDARAIPIRLLETAVAAADNANGSNSGSESDWTLI